MRRSVLFLALALSGCTTVMSAARAITPAVKRMVSCVAECVADEFAAGAPVDGGAK